MNDLTIYDTFAESWWRVGSPLHLLARMNPARFAYFDPLVRHWAGLRVLDVGCGGGLAAACLVQRGARVVGLDLSQASLHVAARQTRHLAVLRRPLPVGELKHSPLPMPALRSSGVRMCWNTSRICMRRSHTWRGC